MPFARFQSSQLLTDAGFVHAFFTRQGGYSTGPYASLNFSVVVGDSEQNVQANLSLASKQLGVGPERICCARQVHGRGVLVLNEQALAAHVQQQEADAVISLHPQQAAGVRTGDCVPVLLADTASGAVAAVHAGWRGVAADVVGVAVERLKSVVDSHGEVVAAIGPHISSAAFEVSRDVAEQLGACSQDRNVVTRVAGKWHVDLARIVRGQLRAAGVPVRCIERVGGCTATHAELYFSYRRDGPQSGRHLSAIVARPACRDRT
jgi:YfiH family protein